MPNEIAFKIVRAGIAATSVRDRDETATTREFTSTEGGQIFVRRLEGFPQELLSMLESQRGVRAMHRPD
jgi:hypothetical protein